VPIVEIMEKEDLFKFLQSPGRVFCVMELKHFAPLSKIEGRPQFEIIARRWVSDSEMLVISNR